MASDRPSIKSDPDQAPKPPWHPFPLTELVNLIGIGCAIVGVIWASGDRQVALIAGGFVLIALSSAELALREHLAGYRSHTLILSGIPAVAVAAVCWLLWHEWALIPRQVAPVVLLAVFGFAFWQLRELFKRRSGGIGFRV